MEDLLRTCYKYSYDPRSSSYSQVAAPLPHYHGDIDTNEGIQIQAPTEPMKVLLPGTCIDDDRHAAVIFDGLSTKRPHDYGLLGTASLAPAVQFDQTAEDDTSAADRQCWQKFAANISDPAQTLICSSPVYSLVSYTNPLFPPTRSHRRKKTKATGGSHDHEANRESIGNDHFQKLVERQRRNKMKGLCSTLISLLPDEYRKTKSTLADKLLEAVQYIRYLQDKVIDLREKRDLIKLSGTVKPFSNSSSVYGNLQASKALVSNVQDKFQTIRVSEFGPGIQVIVNTFKNQIDFSSLLVLLEEAGVHVVSSTVSTINDRSFYSIHSKLSSFRHFDSAGLHRRIGQLMSGNLPNIQ